VQNISCVVTLLTNGRAALATSFCIFKYMALYSVIQSCTVTIVYYYIIDLSTNAYYFVDICTILPLSFTMGMSGANEVLTKFQPTGRLISFPVLFSVIGTGILQILGQVTVLIILQNGNYVEQCPAGFDSEDGPCYTDGSIWIVSTFQYTVVAMAFMAGRPFRKPVWNNYAFSCFFVALILVDSYFCWNPWNDEWFNDDANFAASTMRIYQAGLSGKIFIVAVVNSTLTMFYERIVVKYCSEWYERRKKRRMTTNGERLTVKVL